MLLQRGADVNKQSVSGWTDLQMSEFYNHTVTRTLLQHSASINIKTNDGQTPINPVRQQKHQGDLLLQQ